MTPTGTSTQWHSKPFVMQEISIRKQNANYERKTTFDAVLIIYLINQCEPFANGFKLMYMEKWIDLKAQFLMILAQEHNKT